MRQPAVAGSFYPGTPLGLKQAVLEFLLEAKKRVKSREAYAGVCPHAGYVYSGFTAAHTFASISNLTKPNLTVVFFGPNHTGVGTPISISQDDWLTPLGVAQCDKELSKEIQKNSKHIQFDESAHKGEHSIEVQLPFLQITNPSARFVAICMGDQSTDSAKDVADAVFKSLKSSAAKGKEIVVIASSDFTHYESADSAQKKDTPAISKITKLEADSFNDYVESNNLTICGHAPIAAAAMYAKKCGAKQAELIRYTNSGEASGDYDQVVAYASIGFFK